MKIVVISFIILSIAACQSHKVDKKTVVCIPVYGQSLALGEEAVRLTDFDTLAQYADGRIVTEQLNHDYGYFDNDPLRAFAKQLIGYQKRSFELTVYRMAQYLADHTGKDTLICIFPGGKGATAIKQLGKDSKPYQRFLDNIRNACEKAQRHGWRFVVPALCWMQGESDITDYPSTDYQLLFKQLASDFNRDIKAITGQQQRVEFILYQANPVSRATRFNPQSYACIESRVPTFLMEQVRDDSSCHASGPTYPYTFPREAIHIDAVGQQLNGQLAAMSALDILRHLSHPRGLFPVATDSDDKTVHIRFQIPSPPLQFDTIQVRKAANYGFSVITPDNRNIAQQVSLVDNQIEIRCSEVPVGAKVRYAINGQKGKSGRLSGPRGNLRDSQGDSLSITIDNKRYPVHNWCWQFDIPIHHSQKSANSRKLFNKEP